MPGKHFWSFSLLAAVLASPLNFAATTFVDTLEDIGSNGTPVSSRVIGGVTVTIGNSGSYPMGARTYFDSSPLAFGGA